MPHQCVRCNTFYEDGSKEILKGCKCGGKLFFYVKKSSIDAAKKSVAKLNSGEKKQIELDIYDIIGDRADPDSAVVLDIESIKVLKPGRFELDLVNLFNKEHPLVYKLEEGKYMIDIPSTLQLRKEQS